MKTVGIIGAGISGIVAGYHLKKQGVDFEILEADEALGGVWRQKVYDECFLITSRDSTHLPDSRQPEHYPDFPSAKLFCDYIQRYVDDKGLTPHILTSTRVERAAPQGGAWAVETESGTTRHYQNLVVCTGLNDLPFTPEYPGTFTGESIHSAEYRCFDQFREKRVLVVGGGNSACDIASEAGRVGICSHLSMRTGRWLVPKFSMGIPLTDFQGNAPFWAQKLFVRFLIHMHTGKPERFGLPAPEHGMFEETMIMSQQLPYMLKHGRVNIVPGIERFEGSTVVFTDGRREDYDMVVYATGFRPNISFIDERFLPNSKMGPWVHRRLFARDHRNLFINGYYVNNGAFTQVANVAGELIAKCIAKPERSGQVIAEDIAKYPTEYHSDHVIKNRKSHITALKRLITAID